MASCLQYSNANLGGYFASSKDADEVVAQARAAMADFINAPSADEIVFGQNMTTLTFQMSRTIGRLFAPGDEIILSRMDHDANVWPWVMMARDQGLEVRWLDFDTESFEFDLSKLDTLINARTRLICVGGASNLIGTINDVKSICARAGSDGILTYVDAVQSAPHIPTDVQDIGCDFLVCSAYKFFGPHQGILWGKSDVLQSLEAYKVRPAYDTLPWRFETGTQSHEGMAGTAAAVDYFAEIGATMAVDHHAAWSHFEGRRRDVHAAMDYLRVYEEGLTAQLIGGLKSLAGVKVQGITDLSALHRRVATVSFTHSSKASADIAERLANKNIFVWSGHNYAVEAATALGIYESGGAVRVGPVHYNSAAEVDRLLQELDQILHEGT
jgi:cysteine desulfurase family protein (TIGR01976 family)